MSYDPAADWGSGGIREIGKTGSPLTIDKKGKQPPKKKYQAPPARRKDAEEPPSPARTVDIEA